jgi:hypothetical protein
VFSDFLPDPVVDFWVANHMWIGAGALGILVFWGVWRTFRRKLRTPPPSSDAELEINLNDCPLSAAPPSDRSLTVYHVPVRLRLAVVAPSGREGDVDPLHVEHLLDQVVPGLSEIARWDKPLVRVWPPQLSHHGFSSAFHRHMKRPEADEQESRWVLVAGPAQAGRQTIMVGLALWAEQPNSLGKVILEPHQWRDVLRLQRTAEIL